MISSVLFTCVLTGAAAQSPSAGPITFSISPFADGLHKSNLYWASANVVISNKGESTAVILRHDSLSMPTAQTIDLPKGAVKSVSITYHPTRSEQRFTLERDHSPIARGSFSLNNTSDSDINIGIIGPRSYGLRAIRTTTSLRLPGRFSARMIDPFREVFVGQLNPKTLPTQSQAYDALDRLIWPEPSLKGISRQQIRAISAWVASGGHLIFTVSDHWEQLESSAFSPLLPYELQGLSARPIDGPAFNAEQSLPIVQVNAVGRSQHSWTQSQPPGLYSEQLQSVSQPLIVGRVYGLGVVSVILSDPAQLIKTSQLNAEDFWRSVLWLPTQDTKELILPSLSPSNEKAIRLTQAFFHPARSISGVKPVLTEWLIDIPGVSPVPIRWLMGFAFLYLFLIGPVDYFLLKWAKKQALTWVSYPVIIVLFSSTALVGTSYYKGDQSVMKQFTFVQQLRGTPYWQVQEFVALFATRKAQITVGETRPGALIRPLSGGGFMNNPLVQHEGERGRLRYTAETWTLATVGGDWVDRRPGSLTLIEEGDGLRLTGGLRLKEAYLYLDSVPYSLGDLNGKDVPIDTKSPAITRPDWLPLINGLPIAPDDARYLIGRVDPLWTLEIEGLSSASTQLSIAYIPL